MLRRKVGLLVLLVMISLLAAPGCATLTRKRTQKIPVTSSPAGATVMVNGEAKGTTPLEIRLRRKLKGQTIRIESPGYNPVEIRPKRRMSAGHIMGNFLLAVIPGMGGAFIYSMTHCVAEEGYNAGVLTTWALTSAAFGALFTAIDHHSKGFDLAPRELVVTLTKTDGPPRLETILIDAGDLQNINWIRVHKD